MFWEDKYTRNFKNYIWCVFNLENLKEKKEKCKEENNSHP